VKVRAGWLAILVIVLAPNLAITQTAAPQASQPILIRAGHLLDVRTGRLAADQAILVEGDKITQVGAASEVTAGANARVVDLGDATVLPGMIDVHTHLTMNPKFGYEQLGISIPREALIGARNARATLEAGFTTVRNVGARGYSDIALRDAIAAGDIPGPRMIASGPALGITGGHCDNNLLPFEYHANSDGVADGVAAVQHKVREVIKYGADVIKICATGGVMSKGDDPRASQYTLEEMQAIVADAHRLGRKVAAHAHGAQGILWASKAGVDSVEHGSYIDDAAIAEMKKNGTYLVPTLYLEDWLAENMQKIGLPEMFVIKLRQIAPIVHQNIAHAFRSGVKIALGTDAAVYPHGLNAREFAVYVRLGMTPLQAIQTGTINAADLLGWSDKVGSIAPGKWADIIAVNDDPLRDISALQNVRFVMRNGQIYKDVR
jgi:imidazolonepropionase-like amidohydrolase